jgi:hypothetical protein
MPAMPYLYHVTRATNLASIREGGLESSRHGEVHGSMDVRPPRPAVYLSRKPSSDNLHANLFDGSPLVVLCIAMDDLDANEMWPDDFIYDRVAEGGILATPAAVARALGCEQETARQVHAAIEAGTDETLPEVLKQFWNWYLNHRQGGEVAYTADIPASAIVSVREFAGHGTRFARSRLVPFTPAEDVPESPAPQGPK